MNKIIFDIQRFTEDNSGDTASDALELMHSIIQRFDLKTVDDTKLQGGSSTLNSTLKFIGTFWGSLFFKKSTRTTEVNALTTMLAGTVSIVEDIYAIREEKNKNNPSEVLITAKAEDLISNLTSLTNAFQKLSSGKNSFILSIVSSVVGLAANLVLSMDGLKEDEIEKINKSYVSLLQVSSAEIIKKFFSEGLADNLIKMPVSQILDNSAVKAEIRKQTATNFTKGSGPLGLIFAAITGVLNAANEYDSRVKKYTEDEIPENITKHDARIDAIATFVHDTASYYAKGFDDTVFKWIQAGLSFIRREDIPYYTDKNYVEVITDWFKTLNYENSGTSGDDKFYVLENKSMGYGDSGNDDIGNYGFSNVTIWGGHDDDTLGSYKTDSATPQMNSIFGGPGNDQISVYDKDSTIYGGTGKDFINVVGTNNEIFGDEEDDKFYIVNGANNNTLSGDNGDDFIVMLEEAKNTVIKYASGDGNDTIYGFNEDDSLKISDSYKTTVDGNHLKFTVGEGSILLVDMAGKNINVNGKTIKSGEENSTIEPVPPPEFPTLPATVASPIIYGTESDDTLSYFRFKSYAMIFALDGDDNIYNGSSGRYSGRIHVTMDGGKGNDYIYNCGAEEVSIDGGAGNDYIVLTTTYSGHYDYSDYSTVKGGDGNDTIKNSGGWNVSIDGGGGNDSIQNMCSSVTVNGGADDDDISNYGASGNGLDSVSVDGGSGNDLIYASGRDMTINGGAGHDSIFNDYIIRGNYNNWADESATIDGGTGNDSITNYATNVSIVGGDDNDDIRNYLHYTLIEVGNSSATMNVTIDGGNGKDCIWNGEEYLTGGSSISINGGADNDTIFSRGHSVTISGDKGNDSICNNYGEDILFKYANGDGNDIIEGFNLTSTLSISGSKYSTIKSDDDIIVTVGEGKISLIGAANLSTVHIEGLEDSSSDSKLITLTAGNDNYSNTVEGATINALDGDDTILNEGGASVSINGGAGNDEIHNRNDFVKINGGDGDDRIWNEVSGTLSGGASVYVNAGTGNDTLYNDGDDSTLIGGNGEDYIENWNANVSIDAGASNDIIINNSSGNNSTIFGGAGNDYIDNRYAQNTLFKYKSGDGNDLIHGFNATSTLNITGSAYSTAKSGSDIVVTVGSNKITLAGAGTLSKANIVDATTLILNDKSSAAVTLASAVKTGDASKRTKAIKIIGNALANILNGGASNDTLSGAAGNDKLFGNVGNDSLVGGDGADTLSGGEGNDKLFGNAGNDSIAGGDGHDSINGGADNDKLFGNAGNDSLVGGDGADTLSGSTGDDKLYGDKGNDSLVGGSGDDYLNGGGGADKLFGESGDDKLYGGAGNDNLSGGTGSDTLSGGSGNDTLTGGKGHDLFIYSAGNDVIADFAAGDKISIGAAISGTSIKGSDATFTINKNTLTVKNGKGKEVTVINAKGKEQTLIGGALIVSKSATLENWREVGDASTATAKVKLTGNAKNNTLFGSSKDDTLIGAVGADKLFGNAGNDSLSGGDGADTLSGGAGNDKLYGGKGNDSLWGSAGNDSLWGNAGADTFIYANGEGKDVIYNFDNSDILQITGTFTSSYNKSKKEIAFTVGKTTSALTLKSFTATSFNINGDTYKISGSKLIK